MPQSDEQKEQVAAFLKEYGELTKKHEVDFVSYPMYQPTDDGSWRMVIQTQAISTKGQPIKSPFVPE